METKHSTYYRIFGLLKAAQPHGNISNYIPRENSSENYEIEMPKSEEPRNHTKKVTRFKKL